jgi:hypothetical protein
VTIPSEEYLPEPSERANIGDLIVCAQRWYLAGIPDSFCGRRLVRHLFGTFMETDACAWVMDSETMRSCILLSGLVA